MRDETAHVEEQPMRTVWVVRHAVSAGNAEHLFQGWLDLPLHPDGEREARKLAERFRNEHISHVISSPLQRATATARLLFGHVDEVDAGWVEPAAPLLQGHTITEAAAARPDLLRPDGWPRQDMPPSDALESPSSLRSRVSAALLRSSRAPGDGDVAVVTHGSVLSALLHLAGTPDARPGNLHILHCRVSPGHWRIETQERT